AEDDKLKAASATMPVANFKAFLDHPVPGKAEPVKAQEVYKVLDKVMSAVLTNKDADPGQLLAEAEKAVNQVLANQ
ncbi:sugar ABC transporter substrate-binding protein, partial [Streptomyces xanthophaeus]